MDLKEQAEREQAMQRIAAVIDQALNGEKITDVVMVCAAMIAHCLHDIRPHDREEILRKINAYIRRCWNIDQ